MTSASIRIVAFSLALVAAGTAVIFGLPRGGREPPLEPTAGQTLAAPISSVGEAGSAALKTAPTPGDPAPSSGSGNGIAPSFDVAVIGPAGDAVIAGTAAPGANVELLRNGELQDRAVADQSGQFVIVSALPPGDYQMTLRSKQPDGTQVTSQQSVAVSLKPNVKDELHTALMTPDRASGVLAKPMAPTPTCHPSRAGRR